jgi:GH15 family glucan-1,4-alpha-glucosidase
MSAQSGHREMIRRAADYLILRMTPHGLHGNAFDTWETFVGSFTYSNAAIYAALRVAGQELGEARYTEAAARMKAGVLEHFVRTEGEHSYLVRGFDAHGQPDSAVDSASLGAIEPFGLLDLTDDADLRLAEGTLHIIRERLEVDWEGGRAIRRFEGDAYVGGVPACVNTLWMARCSLLVGARLRELGRTAGADDLRDRARLYLSTVLHRTTPTGLLPELMQGPEGQRYWAAPHGWAMASFVSGVLMLARQL